MWGGGGEGEEEEEKYLVTWGGRVSLLERPSFLQVSFRLKRADVGQFDLIFFDKIRWGGQVVLKGEVQKILISSL